MVDFNYDNPLAVQPPRPSKSVKTEAKLAALIDARDKVITEITTALAPYHHKDMTFAERADVITRVVVELQQKFPEYVIVTAPDDPVSLYVLQPDGLPVTGAFLHGPGEQPKAQV